MSAPTNHWKLGLFVVGSLFAAVAIGVYLAAQSLRKDTVEYKSYFDESVQGLEVGAPLKFRGVTLGNVSLIDVAADRRHVEVSYSMTVKTLSDMKLSRKEGRQSEHERGGRLDRQRQLERRQLRLIAGRAGRCGRHRPLPPDPMSSGRDAPSRAPRMTVSGGVRKEGGEG